MLSVYWVVGQLLPCLLTIVAVKQGDIVQHLHTESVRQPPLPAQPDSLVELSFSSVRSFLVFMSEGKTQD